MAGKIKSVWTYSNTPVHFTVFLCLKSLYKIESFFEFPAFFRCNENYFSFFHRKGLNMVTRGCDVCGGRGYMNNVCPSCNGSPPKYVDDEGYLNDCPTCGNDGYVEEVCSSCGGSGEIKDEEED